MTAPQGDGVPRQVQKHSKTATSAAEEHLATRPEQQQSSARGYVRLGNTATTVMRSARSVDRASSIDFRTVPFASPA